MGASAALTFNGTNGAGLVGTSVVPAGAGWMQVDSGNAYAGASTTVTATFNNAAQVGYGVVVSVFASVSGYVSGTSLTDTLGNVWALLTSDSAGDYPIYTFGCVVQKAWTASGGATPNTLTITVSASINLAIMFDVWSCVGGVGGFDPNVNATHNSGSANATVSLASQFPSAVAVCSGFGFNTSGPVAPTAGTGFTMQSAATGGAQYSFGIEDRVVNGPAGTSVTCGMQGLASGLSSEWTTTAVAMFPAGIAPPSSNHTVCMFIKTVATGSGGLFYHLDNPITTGGGDGISLGVTAAGTAVDIFTGGGSTLASSTFIVGVWTFIAMKCLIVGSTMYLWMYTKTAGAPTCKVTTFSGGVPTGFPFVPMIMSLGTQVVLSNATNALPTFNNSATLSMCGVKIWTDQLSQEEIERESEHVEVARRANLWGYFPLCDLNDLTSRSEITTQLASTLGTGIATTSGPPLPEYVEYPKRVRKRGAAAAIALAVAIAGQTTVGDALTVARSLTAAVAGGATLTAALKVARSVSFSVGGAATFTDTVKVSRALKDATIGGANVTDAATLKRAMAEAISGSTSITATAKLARALLDSMGGLSTYAPTARIVRTMLEAIEGAATVDATLKASRPVAESVHGTASLAAAVKATRPLSEAVVASAVLSPTLKATRPLADAILASATATSTLGRLKTLTDAFAGDAAVLANEKVARAFIGSLLGAGALNSAVKATRPLSEAVAAHASLTEALKASRPLADGVISGATLAAATKTSRPIAEAVHAAVALVAAAHAARPFAEAVLAAANVTAVAKVARPLLYTVTGRTVFTADVDTEGSSDVSLAAAVAGSSVTLDALKVARALGFPVTGTASGVDALIARRALAVAAHASANTVLDAARFRSLAGALAGRSEMTDAIRRYASLAASLEGQTAASAAAFRRNTELAAALTGDATITAIFGGVLPEFISAAMSVSSTNAWLYPLQLKSPMSNIPYFDVPSGWPPVVLPRPPRPR